MSAHYASVPYKQPPTREELQRRLKLGMILKGSDAVLARDYGLGKIVSYWPNQEITLLPNDMKPMTLQRRLKRERMFGNR